MAVEPLTGVSGTALGVARIRAAETRRADALFRDPYAATFVAAAGAPGAAGRSAPDPARAALVRQVTVRTRFYDDELLAGCAAGCRQVVLLAAGLDARAYRLAWPAGVRVFELDLPPVLAFKDRALAGAVPRCARTAVPADLTGDWAGPLTAAGLDPAAPTGWLAEGFLVYLTAGEAAHVLATATALSAPGSRLCCERGDVTALLRNPAPGGAVSMWRGGLGTDTAGWLRRHDWRPTTHDLAEVSTRYGRPAAPAGGFITAGFRAA